jgi:hypothetical protein
MPSKLMGLMSLPFPICQPTSRGPGPARTLAKITVPIGATIHPARLRCSSSQYVEYSSSSRLAGWDRSSPGGKPVHHGFLADGTADPRPEILARLKRQLCSRSSIVAYNANFEKNALRSCSEAYPAFAAWWTKAELRLVDLWQPFRNFHYYHPDQCGSASMKAVLPALTGAGYEDMEIADGATASQEFTRITFGKVPAAERKKVRAALEKYCALDTEGMVRIVEKLSELAAAKH